MTTRANEDIESFATLTRQITRHKSREEALASEESWRERDAARARALASEDVPPEHLNRKQSKKWVAERKKSQLARQRSAEAAAGGLGGAEEDDSNQGYCGSVSSCVIA